MNCYCKMSVVELSTRSKQQMELMQNFLCHQNVLMAENTTNSLIVVCELVPQEFSGISVCKQKLILQIQVHNIHIKEFPYISSLNSKTSQLFLCHLLVLLLPYHSKLHINLPMQTTVKSKKNPPCTRCLESIHKLNEVGPGLFSVSHNLIRIRVSNPGLPIALNEYLYYSIF